MITELVTFLGGAGARLFLGKAFDAFEKWQDQKNELARLRLQGDLDAAQHARNLEAIKVQADLGVKVIEAQTEAHVTYAEADAFLEAVKATGQKTGIWLIDIANGIVRPELAQICIGLWIMALMQQHWVLGDWDRNVIAMALGIFLGGRIHLKGG
jgi:hypothetical protein